jgi:hypothetical protein
MARVRKSNTPATAGDEFDVSSANPASLPSPAFEDEPDEIEDAEPNPPIPTPVHIIETPEQRRLMREKRIAKAEQEQLRRLTRQYPIVAKLVLENERLKKQPPK